MARKYKVILLVCCLVIFGNYIVRVYGIGQQHDTIKTLQKTVASVRTDMARTAEQSPEKTDRRADSIQLLLQQIPEAVMFTWYAASVRTLTDQNSLDVKDSLVFVPQDSGHPDLVAYSTRIRVTGTYSRMKQLLVDLQNLDGLVYIDAVQIAREKEPSDKLQMTLELVAFFKKQGQV